MIEHLWKSWRLRPLLAGMLVLFAAVGHGQAPMEWRPMFLSLQTTTASDQQFLMGTARDGRPTLLAGELRVPARPTAPVPALVMLHGSNGIHRRHHVAWADYFNGLGIATLLIDSFAGRGIDNTANDQSQLGQLAMIYDAYRGLELLAKDPRIDPSRIGLFGSSRGAVASLYASMTRFQRMYQSPGASFAAYLSFYPVCNRTYIDDISLAPRSIRIFHGTADNVAPISRCLAYVRRLRDAGHDVVLTEYPGAYHGFDSPVYPPVTGPAAEPPRGCDIYESSIGRLVNRDTGLTPSPKDACLAQTRTVAYDKAAHAKAIEDVTKVLQRVFGVR